jgi:hypothetical protein
MDSKYLVKNVTFAFGLAFLIYGALNFGIQDWDVGVSLAMAFSTYATADWVVGVFRRSEYEKYLKAFFFIWFSVDGVYFIYWTLVNEDSMMRGIQWYPSLMMYLLCGIIWSALPMPREAVKLFTKMRSK